MDSVPGHHSGGVLYLLPSEICRGVLPFLPICHRLFFGSDISIFHPYPSDSSLIQCLDALDLFSGFYLHPVQRGTSPPFSTKRGQVLRLSPGKAALSGAGGHQLIQLCASGEPIDEGDQGRTVFDKPAPGVGVGHITHLLGRDIQQLCQLLPEDGQDGSNAGFLRLPVDLCRTSVNNGLLLGANALLVDAPHQGHDKLRFHHDGVVLAVAVHHIHGVQAVFAASGHPDNAAQAVHRFNEGGVLPLRVCYENIIVRVENEERDFLLDTERLAGAGNAQPEGGLIEQVCLVAHNKVVGNGVLPEVDAAPVHDLLHLKGHEHGKALGGQGAESVDLPGADGQDGVQAVKLLVFQHRQLAPPGQGAYFFRVAVKLLFAVGGDDKGEDGLHHPLVAGGEVGQKLLALLALQLHIVGDNGREIVVAVSGVACVSSGR